MLIILLPLLFDTEKNVCINFQRLPSSTAIQQTRKSSRRIRLQLQTFLSFKLDVCIATSSWKYLLVPRNVLPVVTSNIPVGMSAIYFLSVRDIFPHLILGDGRPSSKEEEVPSTRGKLLTLLLFHWEMDDNFSYFCLVPYTLSIRPVRRRRGSSLHSTVSRRLEE